MASIRPSSTAVQDLKRQLRIARRLNVFLAVVAVFLLVVALAQPFDAPAGRAKSSDTSAESESGTSSIARRDPKDPLVLGDVDAPVVLVEFADLRCPYCALFTQRTFPVLLKEYVDTGKVRYEFRDVSLFGAQSTEAAVALRAAAAQGRFKQYLTTLYGAAPENKHPDLPRTKLIEFARSAEVPDLEAFARDLDSTELTRAVTNSSKEARDLGVNGVPFFVAGDQVLSGAQPLDVFRQMLDGQLRAAGER